MRLNNCLIPFLAKPVIRASITIPHLSNLTVLFWCIDLNECLHSLVGLCFWLFVFLFWFVLFLRKMSWNVFSFILWMEVVNTGFFSPLCTTCGHSFWFSYHDMFSNFASDHLYFPKHFTHNKYDCHILMVLFKAPVLLSTIGFRDLCDLEHLPGKNI